MSEPGPRAPASEPLNPVHRAMREQMVGTAVSELDTPVALLDLDAFEANTRRMHELLRANGKAWRPHVKAHKSPHLARMLINSGAIGVTCAKVSEAEVMVSQGVGEVLIANEPGSATKWYRVAELQRAARVLACVDDLRHVEWASSSARQAGTNVPLLIEVDTGMGRTGVQSKEDALALASAIHTDPNLTFTGLMGYEGHLLTVTPISDKARAASESGAVLQRLACALREHGYAVSVVSGGGTGTIAVLDKASPLTECQAGGGLLMDRFYAEECQAPFEHALSLLASVTSISHPGQAVIDAGFKALGNVPGLPYPRLRHRDDYDFTGLSAEHGILRLIADEEQKPLQVGDRVEVIPGYSDAMLCLHDFVLGCRSGAVTDVIELSARGAFS